MVFPRRVADPLLGELTLAREQAGDDAAADAAGGRLEVAQALAEVARLELHSPGTGLSAASGSTEARVAYLLDPPQHGLAWLAPPLLVASGLLAAGVGPLHSAIENLITYVAH